MKEIIKNEVMVYGPDFKRVGVRAFGFSTTRLSVRLIRTI